MASRLIPITVPAPGIRGLNLQEQSAVVGPEWARVADNLVIDDTGRLASRDGWTKTHASSIAAFPVEQVFEYKPNTGSNVDLMCLNNKIYKDSSTPTDITGALTITANNWKFQNFNGNVVGYQAGHNPIIWKGTGNFTLLGLEAGASGIVLSNEVLTAFGRTWVVDPATGTTIKYSALLIPQDFSTASGGGSINLQSVWTRGQDKIIALAAFNNNLVIFGKDTITIYSNADDVQNIVLAEVIYDIGCVARDSVQYVDEDLFFLSRTGVRSLKRTILQNKMPQADVSQNVRDDIIGKLAGEDVNSIRSAYSKKNGSYYITFPASAVMYNIDVKKYVASNEVRVFTWSEIEPKSLHVREDDELLMGFAGGFVGTYGGISDNGTAFISKFLSGWTDLAQHLNSMELSSRLVILKRYEAVLISTGNLSPTLTWAFDQSESAQSEQISVLSTGLSEYNTTDVEYNEDDEWSGGATAENFVVNTTGSGRVFSFGLTSNMSGANLSYQYANLMFKLGRVT